MSASSSSDMLTYSDMTGASSSDMLSHRSTGRICCEGGNKPRPGFRCPGKLECGQRVTGLVIQAAQAQHAEGFVALCQKVEGTSG